MKKPVYWPEEVSYEQKLYYLILKMNRIRSSSAFYETSQTFTGQVKRSQEIYFEDLFNFDLQSRGIIPPLHREFYDIPANYDEKVKKAEPPKLPADWDDLYLCGSRCLALPKTRDSILASLTPSYGNDPLDSYIHAQTKSFGHWLAAAKFAKENGKEIPQKPKGRTPEELSDEIKEFLSTVEEQTESKFSIWKRSWLEGKTTAPWRGRVPHGSELPEGYRRPLENQP